MTDYRVEIKVKNNNLLKKIEESGYSSVGEFCRLNNKKAWASHIGEIVNLKKSPLNPDGTFRKIIYDICFILDCMPEDLFSETQLSAELETNKRTIKVGEAEMKFLFDHSIEVKLLEESVMSLRLENKIQETLETLTPREQKIINMRFGLAEYEEVLTLEEVSQLCGVTKERIRQIEKIALRKLRHPIRAEPLRDYIK